MIISHKHKFIFLKTHKTAGTSIEIALSSICDENDLLTPISKNDDLIRYKLYDIKPQNTKIPIHQYSFTDLKNALKKSRWKEYHRHSSAKKLKSQLTSEIWNSYFKFSIERNPYDRLVSLYYWRMGDKKYNSFYAFLTQNKGPGFRTTDKYLINGKIAIDKVYQYENLEFMLDDLTSRLNLKNRLQLPEYRAKSDSRKIKDYRKIIDEKTREWIKINYADVIEQFGYEY